MNMQNLSKLLSRWGVVVICTLMFQSAYAQISEGRYSIISRHSGLALDVDNTQGNGANVLQWEYWGGQNQQFDVTNLGGGYYSIRAVHNGSSLDVYEFSMDPGGEIRTWDYWGGENQQWQITSVGSGYHKIISRHSGLALDVWEWSSANGGDIRQWTDVGGWNQHWSFQPVSGGGSGGGGGGSDPNPDACGQGNPHATVTGSAGNYQVNGNNAGGNYASAINAAINSLSSGRNSPQRVTVFASGSLGTSSISLPSNTTFEVCGTMTVGNAGSGSIQAIGVQNVSIPHLTMSGNPYFGLQFGDVHNLHLGQIDLRFNGGLGIRFDRDRPGSSNVRMDHIYVSGTNNHGVETWNVDGLEIGTVIARNTGYTGLLLNNTRNAIIGLVDGEGTGTGTGYATLRFANTNGRIGNSYPTNIFVDRVVSRAGGRGIFCVSNSGGVRINHIDLANNGNNSILIENCHNVEIRGGTINGGGELRLAARSEFPNNSNITISNVSVSNTSVRENPCGNNINWNNVTVQGGSYNVCN